MKVVLASDENCLSLQLWYSKPLSHKFQMLWHTSQVELYFQMAQFLF